MAAFFQKARFCNYRQYSCMKRDYGYYTDEDGVLRFGCVGQHDVNDVIKAAYASTDMQVLLESFLDNPENGFVIDPACYGDISELPTNILELSAVAEKARMAFSTLPLEVRQNYGSDIYKFLTEVGNGDFKKKFAPRVESSDKDSGQRGGKSDGFGGTKDVKGDGISTKSGGADSAGGSEN